MEWQPIETAPKDESVTLIGFARKWQLEGTRRVYEGRWNEEQAAKHKAADSSFVRNLVVATSEMLKA